MPDWTNEIRERLEPLKLTPAREAAVSDDLTQHLDDHYAELMAGGTSEDEARRAALADLDRHELMRGLRRVETETNWEPEPGAGFLSGLAQDFRYSLRALRKNPGFGLVEILTLALGISANAAIFSVINSLFLHPPGVADSSRLVAIRVKYDKLNLKNIGISLTDFADARDSKQVFASAAATQPNSYNYTANALPERLLGADVTWQWFDTLGAKPLLGRGFLAEEDVPGGNHVVVLSYGTWQKLFGGDNSIVGKSILLNDQSYRVIGVMDSQFNWPIDTQVWVPMGLAAKEYGPQNRFNESVDAVARLAPGVSVLQAESYMKVLTERLIPGFRDGGNYARSSQWGMFAMPLTEYVYGDLRTPMLILWVTVGFVLLICCANVAGLMLAKASGRAKEFAVRVALGARRWRLLRQVLVETTLLAGAGTLAGLGLARIAVGFAGVIAPANTIGTLTIPMDRSVLLFSVGVGLLSALLAGIAPAWAIAGSKSFAPLKEGGRTGTVSKGRQRARSLLVVGEIGLALVLLVGAGLFLKSLVRLQQLNPGFDPRGVMTAAVTLVPRAYASDAKQEAFYLALTQNLAHQPGIDAAGVAFGMPFSNLQGGSSFDIEGRQLGPGDPGPHSDLAAVTGGFFQTLSIPLRAGRYFTDQDNATSEPVAIIDETLARQYWPGQSPIGQRIKNGGPKWSTIVGVVAHVNRSALAGDSGKGLSYYSLLQIAIPMSHVVVRTSGNPASAGDVIRQAVKTVDPSQAAAYEFKPMQDRVAASLGPRRFAANMLTTFAAIALLMAAIGLYGVISYSVAQRTQEIGIRMALGARMSQVLYMIFAHAMGLVLAGIAIGLVAGALLARLLSAELVQVSAFDPLTFLGMSALLVVVTLAATYLPARRAAKVDPMVALRYE